MMMIRKRAQAALEFLTTYGWAFLVILVMIGALSYFGVLDPSRFLPDKCIFGTGVGACADSIASISGGYIKADLINSFGQDVVISNVSFTTQGIAGACAANNVCGATPYCFSSVNWPNNGKNTLQFTPCALAQGDKPKVHVIIKYETVGGAYNHTVEGDIQLKVTP